MGRICKKSGEQKEKKRDRRRVGDIETCIEREKKNGVEESREESGMERNRKEGEAEWR